MVGIYIIIVRNKYCHHNYLEAGEVSVDAADAELAKFSKVLKDSIDIPSWAFITDCCIPVFPLNDIPILGLTDFVFNLLILKIAEGFWLEIIPRYCQAGSEFACSGLLGGQQKYTAPPVPSGNGCWPVKNT